MTLHQFPNPESIAGSGKGTQFPGSLSYFPVLCSVLGAADIKTTMPALKVCTFLVTPVLLSLFQGRGFPVTGQTFSPLQPTRSLFGFPCYAPSLSLFRPSPPSAETKGFTLKPVLGELARDARNCCLLLAASRSNGLTAVRAVLAAVPLASRSTLSVSPRCLSALFSKIFAALKPKLLNP